MLSPTQAASVASQTAAGRPLFGAAIQLVTSTGTSAWPGWSGPQPALYPISVTHFYPRCLFTQSLQSTLLYALTG
jgi:hypothetical protein